MKVAMILSREQYNKLSPELRGWFDGVGVDNDHPT